MNECWEDVTSEKDIQIHKDVKISVEKIGKDIVSVVVSTVDKKIKISKKSDYSTSLNFLKPAEKSNTIIKYSVVANKGGDTMQCTRDTFAEAEDVKLDLEMSGWKAEIVETEEVVKIDIISGKEKEIDEIPF